ncbi:MAG: glycosyltransferase [Thermotogae bacterium]|nr:glycosyltransferase [Thermotogota bacterium]
MRFQLLPSGEPLSGIRGDWVVVYDPDSLILTLPGDLPDAPMVLTFYVQDDKIRRPTDFKDITERAILGPLRFYHGDYLRRIRAEDYGEVWEYYARLRLYVEGLKQRVIPRVLAAIPSDPGFGKLHTEAFRYLQYGADYERKVETIFYGFLKEIGAYLNEGLNLSLREKPHSPAISVITPVRNRVKFIGEAIESVLNNDFQDWEMVIVDNGSEDGTAEIVERFSRRDKRVKLVRTSGRSLTECLNLAVKHSKGWVIAQLDSDDTYTPTALREIYDYHANHNVGLAISYYRVVDEEGNTIEDLPIVKHLEYSLNNLLRVEGAGAVRSYRREALLRVGGFDERALPDFAEDYDLVLRLSEWFLVGRIHAVLYNYRRHPHSTDAERDPFNKARIKTGIRWATIHRRRLLNFARHLSLQRTGAHRMNL